MIRVDRRKALLFGSFGAALLFVPLALLVLGVSGMECQDCGIDRSTIAAILLLALLASMFGLVAGCAAAALKPRLDQRIHPLAANVLLALAIAAATVPVFRSTPWLLDYAGYLATRTQGMSSHCDQRKLPPNVICAY